MTAGHGCQKNNIRLWVRQWTAEVVDMSCGSVVDLKAAMLHLHHIWLFIMQ